jgi:hypothetical protein
VKIRRSAIDKKNVVEKIDQDFAPYQIAEEFPWIEAAFWECGAKCLRSAYAWLQHRFCAALQGFYTVNPCTRQSSVIFLACAGKICGCTQFVPAYHADCDR